MSKLLSSVLDKISEDNNEYRDELRNLNGKIDEITTSIVSDIVTLSNYNADFSNMVTSVKEKLVDPIYRTIESYVIKDLRSVEAVNEQFVEKINDKIDGAEINNEEDKDKFIDSLNTLLNDKYLEIVKIKRIDFFNEYGVNRDIEDKVNIFINELLNSSNYDEESLTSIFSDYKNDLYSNIKVCLEKISKNYLSNFANEIISALNGSIDFDNINTEENFKPYIPEINPIKEELVPEAPIITETPVIPEIPEVPEIPEIPEMPVIPEFDEEPVIIPEIPVAPTFEEPEVKPMIEEVVAPITEIEPVEEKKEPYSNTQKLYDVEEILKRAKSPIVTMPVKEPKEELYINIKASTPEEETETSDTNEKELVEEMIRRLNKRLSEINAKEEEINNEAVQLDEDEEFVNNLIENSNNKKSELDKLEKSLEDKETELNTKEAELNKKINDIMPFANAVLKADK